MKIELMMIILILFCLSSCIVDQKNNTEVIKDSLCLKSVKPIDIGYVRPFWPFSPDSEWIAYNNIPPETGITRNEPEGVYLIKYDGSKKRFLSKDGYRPSFARDQWKIVYTREGSSKAPGPKGKGFEHDLFVIDFNGKNEVQLTNTEYPEVMKIWGGPSMTYDGKKVVYMIYGKGIWIVNNDGSNPRELYDFSGSAAGFSADGKRIYTTKVNEIKNGFISIGSVDLDNNKDQKWLTFIKFPENDYTHMSINSDASLATYDNPRWENRNIWIVKLDGSNNHIPLTFHKGKFGEKGVVWANHPRFSPDSNWIVYDEQTNAGNALKNKIMIINTNTGEKKEIYQGIIPGHCGMMEPGWSPDGKKIIFYAPDPKNDDKYSVWVAVLEEC